MSAAGNDRIWGPESAFKIVIHPPFWDTLAARIFYAILVILLIFGLIYVINRRNRQKMIRMQEEEALKQKEELDQMKFRFFTNISHELRTPLTLIITPLDMVIRRLTDDAMKKQLNTIYKNAQNLLSLVNQLLDFRKLEMKGERLHLMNGDMEEFIVSAYNNFMPMAVEKHLNFVNQSEHRALYMFFDRDKVHKIMNNLFVQCLQIYAGRRDGRLTACNRRNRRKKLRENIRIRHWNRNIRIRPSLYLRPFLSGRK